MRLMLSVYAIANICLRTRWSGVLDEDENCCSIKRVSVLDAAGAPKEVPLGCAPKEVPLGCAPKEVPLGCAPKEVPLGCAPKG